MMTRVAPHNIEAEQSVIGSTLLQGYLLPELDLRPEDYYRGAHRTILMCIQELDESGSSTDPVTVSDALRAKGQLEEVGGASYLASLMDLTPTLSIDSLVSYSKIIKEKALRRQIIRIAYEIHQGATNEELAIEELIAQASTQLANIGDSGSHDHFKDMQTLAKEGIARAEARSRRPGYVTGIPTPFKKLNQITNGLQPSDLIVLAGRPSMGKSSFGQQVAEHTAEHSGPTVIFSLEMDADSLIDRSFASGARIPSQRIRSGHLQDKDWPRLVRTAGRLAKLPILTVDAPSLTGQQIRFLARQAKARMGGLSLVVIDYLGLIRPDRREKQRYLEIAEFTRTLKQVARELKTAVLLLSQLNRSCESRENKRPLLADLRESGDIEQDADVVLFIYRDEYYCPLCSKGKRTECTKGHQGLAEVIVAKQRKGPTGTVSLVWQEQYTRFEDRAVE